MTGARNKGDRGGARRAIVAMAAILALCLLPIGLEAQHQNNPRPSAPRYSAPRQQNTHPQSPRQPNAGSRPVQRYPNAQYASRPPQPQYQPYRAPAPGAGQYQQRPPANSYAPQSGVRPAFPNAPANSPYGRPAYPGTAQQLYAPPGHLGAWLNTHRNVPVPQQEQQLRNDPSFRRLPQGEQQRLVNQLHQVNQMPDGQRERRLARAENLERLSPEQRAEVAQSTRRFATLPSGRQTMMRNAFRDLRAVPPDQRGIVLNSSRYQGQFSPEERGILSNMLSVEPYAPPQQ